MRTGMHVCFILCTAFSSNIFQGSPGFSLENVHETCSDLVQNNTLTNTTRFGGVGYEICSSRWLKNNFTGSLFYLKFYVMKYNMYL